ncbi:hypothetical protein [Venenivibrio stagnispumantis]|uniref:hypothetical protein n=1 Tax=Venenivibrio stagnispumantis TaxID=407998 RepID=UPI00223648B0|nr:hypothetical protein [Venenivibrio stagnispumantis]MCW4573984.1 hypothetical protein [Venenivibrio stagnispumantis]
MENKTACVKINGRLEITRPVALAMLNHLSRDIASIGGSVEFKKDILSFNPVVVKAGIRITLPNGAVLQFESLGGAEEQDIKGEKRIYHDALGTAETRATKRLLEEVVGEDFINKLLMSGAISEAQTQKKPATDKQKAYLKKLIQAGKIKSVDVESLSFEEASHLIDKAKQN